MRRGPVDQSENSPTVLVFSSGWVPAGVGAVSSEDREPGTLKFL